MRDWWGGRFSYTLSSTKDNQFGQSNTYAWRTATPQNNYDLDAEYGISIFDSPHRIILAPIVKFPATERQERHRLPAGRRLERVGGRRAGERRRR